MLQSIKRLAISSSIVLGASAIASIPAFAQSSIVVNSVTGSAPYKVYDASGSSTFEITPNLTNINKVLDGNAGSPTGNVELASNSEVSGFNFLTSTNLNGTIGGKSLTLSSLTFADWFGNGSTAYQTSSPTNLASKWFNDFITNAGYGALVGSNFATNAYNGFLVAGGFQASSDPNISYVNQDANGLISIGLAGHYNLKAAYAADPKFATFAQLLPNGFQASELVKYNYDGKTGYLYSFSATASGLSAGDTKNSHSGNYEVSFQGTPPAKTPEPTAVLGLMAIGGAAATFKRKLSKAV